MVNGILIVMAMVASVQWCSLYGEWCFNGRVFMVSGILIVMAMVASVLIVVTKW